jgi:hypothetical protein
MPTERAEAILAGMVAAFDFFGCVPREVWWDNPKTVAKEILKGRQRKLHNRYQALASHYCFEPLFCMPASGNEKPYVENSVYDLQRDWATPVPKVEDLDQLNEYLRQCCLRKRAHQMAGKTETVGERFQRDKASAGSLPKHAFDPCVYQPARVDKYQTIRFDSNRYTVPRRWAFETVTVKAYIDRIDIVTADTAIASHRRSYDRGQLIFQEEHYLAILGRRPAALDHSAVFRQWKLPACFQHLRENLQTRHGEAPGARQYIRVLQLLAQHPAQRVQQAIELCAHKTSLHADLIINATERLTQHHRDNDIRPTESSVIDNSDAVQVPRPDLNRFDQFLTQLQGESNDVTRPTTIIEGESQTTAFTGYPGRTREIGPGSRPAERRLQPVLASSG